MDRRDWISAFIAELERLRPHLAPSWGASKIAQAIAISEYRDDVEPAIAAQRYHARQPAKKAKR